MPTYKDRALRHAESIGVYEYKVNGKYMEYWSLFYDGFYFYRYDIEADNTTVICHLPWRKEEGFPVPAFLLSETGATLYNYLVG